MSFERENDRANNDIRPITVNYDYVGYASASVLLCMGKTKVLASVTLQDGVPRFLRGKKTGWLTAEYAMLPCATKRRTNRESSQHFRNPRSVEISRLIGRSLRTVVDFSLLGEKTITIDCDVLQADGGTRVASVTAASLALHVAQRRWLKSEIIKSKIITEEVAAISLGYVKDELLLDLCFFEDSQADSDFNFILTKSGKLIEVQGTAEKTPLNWQQFDDLKKLAIEGVSKVFNVFDGLNEKRKAEHFSNKNINSTSNNRIQKQPLFSLASRLGK